MEGHPSRQGMKLLALAAACTTFLVMCIFVYRLSVNRCPTDLQCKHTVHRLRPTKKVQGPWKVLIVAYYRSGSTLTGTVFSDNKETFYVFEPLHPLNSVTVARGLELKYFNGSKRPCPIEASYRQEISSNILSAMLSCRFDEVDIVTLTHMMCTVITPGNERFCQCLHKKTTDQILTQCVPSYIKKCEGSKYRVIKTIRVSMAEVTSVLASHPDLKVIHLLRDPRGMMCSPLFSKDCNVTQAQITGLCSEVTKAINAGRQLDRHHSGQFLQVIYEDLVKNPYKTAESMYRLVDSSLPGYIKTILYNKTLSRTRTDGAYGTYRKDSIGTAYRWTSRIPWDTNVYAQEHCMDFLKEGRYPVFKDKSDLQTYRVVGRVKTE